MKTTVIFDLDGTLTNTVQDICDNVNLAMRKFGFPDITPDEARRFVGSGAKALIERSLKGKETDNLDEIVDFYNASYNFCGSPKTFVYDGMKELLTKLKSEGYRLAVVSNKPQEGTDEVVEKFFGKGVFDYAFGQRKGVKTKPDPQPIDITLAALGVDKKDAVYVGDSEVDVKTASASGLDGITVLWGYRDRDLLESVGATVFAKTADELYGLIKGF